MRIDQSESIELAPVAGIAQGAEASPIHFEAFAGEGLHAHEGTLSGELRANFPHILLQDTGATAITQRTQQTFVRSSLSYYIVLQRISSR